MVAFRPSTSAATRLSALEHGFRNWSSTKSGAVSVALDGEGRTPEMRAREFDGVLREALDLGLGEADQGERKLLNQSLDGGLE